MQKGLVQFILLIILTIALILGVGYYSWKNDLLNLQKETVSNSQTANIGWKGYRDPEGKYQLEYPSHWDFRKMGFPEEPMVGFGIYQDISRPKDYFVITESSLSEEEQVEYTLFAGQGRITQDDTIILDGINARKIVNRLPGVNKTYRGGGYTEFYNIILSHNSIVYDIQFSKHKESIEEFSYAEKVLSTLKFLK